MAKIGNVKCEIRLYRCHTKSWMSIFSEIAADRPEYPNWKDDIINIVEDRFCAWKVKGIHIKELRLSFHM